MGFPVCLTGKEPEWTWGVFYLYNWKLLEIKQSDKHPCHLKDSHGGGGEKIFIVRFFPIHYFGVSCIPSSHDQFVLTLVGCLENRNSSTMYIMSPPKDTRCCLPNLAVSRINQKITARINELHITLREWKEGAAVLYCDNLSNMMRLTLTSENWRWGNTLQTGSCAFSQSWL